VAVAIERAREVQAGPHVRELRDIDHWRRNVPVRHVTCTELALIVTAPACHCTVATQCARVRGTRDDPGRIG